MHSLDEARTYAEKAMGLLQVHDVPPAPLGYAVAYAYFGGEDERLRETLDGVLQQGRSLDLFMLRDLHERFFGTDQLRELQGMGNELQQLLGNLAHNVDEAGAGTTAFGQALTESLRNLNGEIAPATLQAVAADMLAATRQAQVRNDQLQQRLEATLAETERLKGELEQQRRAALTDPLTGLLNRRAMESHLGDLMAPGVLTPLSVVMVDIDHFKRVNDNYGHALGDAVIRNVAEVIRKCIGSDDFAVRYGGEEFVVVLPGMPLDNAAVLAETMRARIAALRLVRRRDNFTLGPFTASFGVAARRDDDTCDSLLQRADQGLYLSKGSGRNRVTLESAISA
jgi:diguanylate cyclase